MQHGTQSPDGVGFLGRWVAPALFVPIVIAAFWVLARVSMPLLGPESEMPEKHLEIACGLCHRAEPGFDPETLLDR